MSNPTPNDALVNTFVGTVVSLGGKAGNGRLQRELDWNDNDYAWVRDYLISQGRVRIGRGRGGSVQLVQPEELEAAQAEAQAKQDAAEDKPLQAEGEVELEPIESIKAKYTPIPEDVSAFSPGMKVSRPLTQLFKKEDFLWRNLKHYVVTDVADDKIYVKPRNAKKGDVALSAPPKGFYQRVK